MKAVELKPDIYWVGAVDYNLRDFHHYSRSPMGTTYNAYLIRDEKTVLFDSVAHGYVGELCKHIANIVEPEKIDYIVCHHMEKDHAGALPMMVERCKPEKIFCSVMGEKSLRAQFKADNWPIQVVKDGEQISIGKRTLTFLEARMLHWPDSMFSYVAEDKVLFCNDAFGQNIATSYRYADEYDDPLQLAKAMRNYYNNIILPFSPQALKLLERLKSLNLPIDVVAPDHGLIFRRPEDIQKIIELYQEFAEQKPQLGAVIAYETMWSGTEEMAYAVGDGLREEGVPYTILDVRKNHCSAVMDALGEAGALILGSATRNNMPMVNMMATIAHLKGLRPKNRVGASFGCYGWSGEAPKMLAEELKNMNMDVIGEPLRALFRPMPYDLENCRELGKKVARALKQKIEDSKSAQ